jgi:hypothetical protein
MRADYLAERLIVRHPDNVQCGHVQLDDRARCRFVIRKPRRTSIR